MNKPIASLSLDLDNKWSYLKTHGDESWHQFPSYLHTVGPRFLEIFAARKSKITVFVVGQDAALPSNRNALSSIATAGHEIGNHSFHHEPWLHLYEHNQLVKELADSESAIKKATGQITVGFRGPGFSISDEVLNMLADRQYEYDATIFPTFLGPVARTYFFLRSGLNRDQRKQRKALFGRFSDGWRPIKPFAWQFSESNLIELPVTTMPIFKLPIHLSYILYLAKYSRQLAGFYFRRSMQMCRWFGVEPSILFHPLDFMGREDDSELAFFPAMDLPRDYKLQIVGDVLDNIAKHYEMVCMREHCSRSREKNLSFRNTSMVRPATS